MSDTVVAALVGVGGAVIVAISSAVAQYRITNKVIIAERSKIAEQISWESKERAKEKRFDRLQESIAELLVAADPEVAPGIEYCIVVKQINKLQLLLDRSKKYEAKLYVSLMNLGTILQAYDHGEVDISLGMTQVFEAHAKVIEAAKVVLDT